MLGQSFRQRNEFPHSSTLSRDLDRYPKAIVTDFRKLEPNSLRRICRSFDVSNGYEVTSKPELSRIVANRFQNDFHVDERSVLINFVRFTNELSNNYQGNVSRSNKRYGTRSTRGIGTDDGSDAGNGTFNSGPVSQPLYCICNRVSFGEMIGCDNADCEIEWFHVGCVGLKSGSLGSSVWYCPSCRSKMPSKQKGAEQKEMSSSGRSLPYERRKYGKRETRRNGNTNSRRSERSNGYTTNSRNGTSSSKSSDSGNTIGSGNHSLGRRRKELPMSNLGHNGDDNLRKRRRMRVTEENNLDGR